MEQKSHILSLASSPLVLLLQRVDKKIAQNISAVLLLIPG